MDRFFEAFGNISIVAKKASSGNNDLGNARATHMRETYGKLYVLNQNGFRVTFKWRTIIYEALCTTQMVWDVSTSPPEKIDCFLNNEVAKSAFRKFAKYGCVSTAKTSISALIRFDAIITDLVGVLLVFDSKIAHYST